MFGFPCGSAGEEFICNEGDLDLIPGLGRSLEKGKATHSSILAWRISWTVKSMGSQSWTGLSDFHFHFLQSLFMTKHKIQFSSVAQLYSTLRPHELQHARSPSPSPTPRVHPCPSSQWHYPTISFSVVSFSSCPQSLLASGSFPMSQPFFFLI